ncbi:hypothetical protein ELI45_32680 (plasmid) [Rhizobium ruizarguesonis]|nr:hypothetical protein ELI45_32680 [Rhizobium ruizarguesonis]TAV03431.1 hypothetical protein ELI34_30330 [Rhizobium ruizarguesonis]TAV22600.1 hypothetical protein ELI35_31095 [Rhizobium ruizarguesonis]TAW61418.1 hypothetical protein ELI16_32525 [Rhizobium ruizarguesonis]TAW70165.1 hypothetical protein ELI11_35190 [Rhizobium ruizarguesonis]
MASSARQPEIKNTHQSPRPQPRQPLEDPHLVLEPAEHVFDLVAFFVERRIMWDDDLAVCPRWNEGRDLACGQGVPKTSRRHSPCRQ